jgi:hypothetical protein
MFVSFVKHWAVPETDPGYLQVLNSERIRLGILQDIPLMRCKGITAPMLMGLFNPVILLPDMDFDSDDLPFIFRHELIHFKRHDLLYKLALALVKGVHWFNPAVRLMARQANKDIETICDAYTVNGTDIDFRRKYSEVILSMASGPVTCHSQLTTCMNGGKHMLRQRFSNILGGEKKNGALMFVLIGAVMFALGTLVGFNFQPRHEQAANEYAMAVGEAAEAMEAENASEAVGSPWTPVEVRVPAGFDRSELAKLVERTVEQSVRNSFSSEYNDRYIGSNGHVDASQIYDEPIKKESYHDGVKSLEISSCMADIVVKQGGDRLKVEYDERFKGEYMLTIINGALKIICNDMLLPSTPANSEIFDAKWKQTAIIVTVPEEAVLDSINGASVSGDISIEGVSLSGVSYDHVITAETVSGKIEITDCTAGGRFNLKSTSGDIAVSDCEVEDYITANLVSGDVFFDSCSALNINISAISGYSQLKDCSFGSLNMYAVSGSTNIALKEDASFYDVLFNSVSGSCYMNGAAVETEGVFRQNLTGAQSNITFTSSSGSLWIDG